MADIADIGSDYAQMMLDNAISRRKRFDGDSLKECEQCGDPIPKQRQKLGGVRLCISCQSESERCK